MRLPSERDLAKELKVSRPALREGTRRLLDAGALEARRGAGTFIAAVDFAELMEVRLGLEPLAAGLAATNCGEPALSELLAIARTLPAVVDQPERLAKADQQIHGIVARDSGNAILQRLLAQLDDMTLLSRAGTVQDGGVRGEAVTGLSVLIDRLCARDASGAEDAMRAHLLAVTEGRPPGQQRSP